MMMRFGVVVFLVVMTAWVTAQARSIAVNGTAIKNQEPNIIIVNFEIWAKGVTAQQAQQTSAIQYQKMKKNFDSFQVQRQDISTENYSLSPEYSYDQKTQQNKMMGFRVGQNMLVTLRKTEDIGRFLDGIAISSKNNEYGVSINSIQWDSDKHAQIEIAGLGEAVRDAKAKADEMAKAAGVKIKNVISLSHGVSSAPPPGPAFGRAMLKSSAGNDASTELAVGQIKVRVEVQAEYEIN